MAGRIVKDVVIAGGGVIGMSVAFNLTKFIDPSRICVLEPEPTYVRSASALSWASIRQQFSLAENIKLSQSSIKFIKEIDQHLRVPGDEDVVDIHYKHGSYLFLAREEDADRLETNIAVQKEANVKVHRYNQSELKEKYPYLNLEDIVLGSDCGEDEGWFDPWLLLSAYKNKIKSLGVDIVTCRVTGFNPDKSLLVHDLKTNRTQTLHYSKFVNSTGIHAKFTNNLLNSALSSDSRFNLPVTPQRHYTFNIACKEGPSDLPLTLCPLKTVIRSEGPNYIVKSSAGTFVDDEEELKDFGDVDDANFIEDIWENLAYRIPAFEATKILGGWVGYYEYNTLDQNALIGPHPAIPDHYFINGFSGHGIQQSPAAGQCLAEIMCGVQPHLDISNLSLDRVVENRPYMERNIY
ncbi:FAD-dependent oxidoreductase domain-containing protein 1-like [Bolinopsis microptera]|uniref:FAD-dependent oxidoreductase domain-containing protein 1-like n=1 Tax=Bolinopsis microptera TaxID=2820187 RepID=UPI003079C279